MASTASSTDARKCGFSIKRLMDGHPRHADENLLYTTNRRGGAHHQHHNKKGKITLAQYNLLRKVQARWRGIRVRRGQDLTDYSGPGLVGRRDCELEGVAGEEGKPRTKGRCKMHCDGCRGRAKKWEDSVKKHGSRAALRVNMNMWCGAWDPVDVRAPCAGQNDGPSKGKCPLVVNSKEDLEELSKLLHDKDTCEKCKGIDVARLARTWVQGQRHRTYQQVMKLLRYLIFFCVVLMYVVDG